MNTTLDKGDYILVNKIIYGPRVVNFKKLFCQKKLDFHWLRGLYEPKKGDVIVFNLPDYNSLKSGEFPSIYGPIAIKRCYGEAGDTIDILHNMTQEDKVVNRFKLKLFSNDTTIFPYDSSLCWTLDTYGPIWIPVKGGEISLTQTNAKWYYDVLLYEGNKTEIRNNTLFYCDTCLNNYTFKENYYFMLGDNFYNSIDSRYFGLLPQKNIIGKATYILFSLDPDLPWYRKFRWKRFMKRID